MEFELIIIFGCARSGTTVLSQLLNSSDDTLIIEEADLFLTSKVNNFRGFFNRWKLSQCPYPRKGFYLPNFVPSTLNGDQTMQFCHKLYSTIGEKIAFGPGRELEIPILLEHFSKMAQDSIFLFTIRNPVDCIFSMKKMFRQSSIDDLILWYSAVIMLQLYWFSVAKRVHIYDSEVADSGAVEELLALLNIDPKNCDAEVFDRSKIHTNTSKKRFIRYAKTKAARRALSSLTAVYRIFRKYAVNYPAAPSIVPRKKATLFKDHHRLYCGLMAVIRRMGGDIDSIINFLPDSTDAMTVERMRAEKVIDYFLDGVVSKDEVSDELDFLSCFPEHSAKLLYARGYHADLNNNFADAEKYYLEAESAGYFKYWTSYHLCHLYLRFGYAEKAKISFMVAESVAATDEVIGLNELRKLIGLEVGCESFAGMPEVQSIRVGGHI